MDAMLTTGSPFVETLYAACFGKDAGDGQADGRYSVYAPAFSPGIAPVLHQLREEAAIVLCRESRALSAALEEL